MQTASEAVVPVAIQPKELEDCITYLRKNLDMVPNDLLHMGMRAKIVDVLNNASVEGVESVREYFDAHPEESVVIKILLEQYAIQFGKRLVDNVAFAQSMREARERAKLLRNKWRLTRAIGVLFGVGENETALIKQYETIMAEVNAIEREKMKLGDELRKSREDMDKAEKDAYSDRVEKNVRAVEEAQKILREAETKNREADKKLLDAGEKMKELLEKAMTESTKIVSALGEPLDVRRKDALQHIEKLEARLAVLTSEVNGKEQLAHELSKNPDIAKEWGCRRLGEDKKVSSDDEEIRRIIIGEATRESFGMDYAQKVRRAFLRPRVEKMMKNILDEPKPRDKEGENIGSALSDDGAEHNGLPKELMMNKELFFGHESPTSKIDEDEEWFFDGRDGASYGMVGGCVYKEFLLRAKMNGESIVSETCERIYIAVGGLNVEEDDVPCKKLVIGEDTLYRISTTNEKVYAGGVIMAPCAADVDLWKEKIAQLKGLERADRTLVI